MPNDASREMLKSMLRIRRVEEALAERYSDQKMRCPMHLCIGQEAIPVGVSIALKGIDKVFSNHRAHGHYLAKGANLRSMIAELYGRETGCCGGRGGSMHLIDLEAGFMGATPIVGGTIPLAVGSAWASKLQGNKQVTVVYFGDGCFEEGVMHESLNFAALHCLPVLFICENNNFSVYTHQKDRQPNRPLFLIAEAHGIKSAMGNGNDVDRVHEMALTACQDIRDGFGPWFLEFSVFRWREHCGPDFDDHLNYRNPEDIQAGIAACPIEAYKKKQFEIGCLKPEDLDEIEREIKEEISIIFESVLNDRLPNLDDARSFLYA